MMKFKNGIRFKHGTLNRGDGCLFRSIPAIYMGSYAINKKWHHMFLINEVVSFNLVFVEESIFVIDDLDDIVCKVQECPAEEGQMALC